MSTAQQVIEKLGVLSEEQQAEVLRLIGVLAAKNGKTTKRVSPFGLWKGLGIDISAEDIDQARRETWGNFPREDIV